MNAELRIGVVLDAYDLGPNVVLDIEELELVMSKWRKVWDGGCGYSIVVGDV